MIIKLNGYNDHNNHDNGNINSFVFSFSVNCNWLFYKVHWNCSRSDKMSLATLKVLNQSETAWITRAATAILHLQRFVIDRPSSVLWNAKRVFVNDLIGTLQDGRDELNFAELHHLLDEGLLLQRLMGPIGIHVHQIQLWVLGSFEEVVVAHIRRWIVDLVCK